MSKGKPQQQLYRPGSGPLRKSENETNRYDSGSNVSLNSLVDDRRDNSGPNRGRSNKYRQENPNEFNKLLSDVNGLNISQTTSISTNNLTDKRRNKKPEQPIYVPKPVAHARGGNSEKSPTFESVSEPYIDTAGRLDRDYYDGRHRHGGNRDHRNGLNNQFGSSDHINANRGKRYHNVRRYGCPNDGDFKQDNDRGGWRTHSPSGQNRRDLRQNSEPRTIGPSQDSNRIRDTRSVEPAMPRERTRTWQSEKLQYKPPSGRRNSAFSMNSDSNNKRSKPPLNLDALPPRLRQKYLAENGMGPSNYTPNSDDSWDGSSVTFQGTGNGNYRQPHNVPRNQNYHMPPPQMHPMHHPHYNQPMMQGRGHPMPPLWSQTLPNMKSRGRGRLRAEDLEVYQAGMIPRSVTPDKVSLMSPGNSRPTTPLQFRAVSNEQLNRPDNRCQTQTPVKMGKMYQGLRTPPPHITTPPEQFRRNSIPYEPISSTSPPFENTLPKSPQEADTLDWCDDVERTVEPEGVLSDAMTRSSSMASLADSSVCHTHPPKDKRRKKRRNKRGEGRNRSSSRNSRSGRERSIENNQYRSGRNESNDRSKDGDNTNRYDRNRRSYSGDRSNNFKCKNSRDVSNDRTRKNSEQERQNWREEIKGRHNFDREPSKDPEMKTSSGQAPGILVLPKDSSNQIEVARSVTRVDSHSGYSRNAGPMQNQQFPSQSNIQQKTLFDPHNPNKPIVVPVLNNRSSVPDQSLDQVQYPDVNATPTYLTDQFGNLKPAWYDLANNSHNPRLLMEIERADLQLQWIIDAGYILRDWNKVSSIRQFLQQGLHRLLSTDLKFCQTENVEHHFWKILFHNPIELMRNAIRTGGETEKQYKELMLAIIEDGTKYFEGLLRQLELVYQFKIDDYLKMKNVNPPKGLGYVGLALISTQKIFLFLGDLARYRDQINETQNYGKSRHWYIKAQQLNPKNGRPYNQLAILAIYAKRKLDAVYYYMRSLMSSNPFHSARESLNSLFDENRKKYELNGRKRREEKARLRMKERERSMSGNNSLRKEIWIHPEGGRRVHRTTNAQPDLHNDSDEEDLSKLSSAEVNKRFITSYLHVHGKLIMKIGMETFQEAALQMLKEFRALLQHSPIPLNCNRFLQLLALNMFAIENTQLKDPQMEQGYRSEVQECALVISLQMFNLILERCVTLLREELEKREQLMKDPSSTPLIILGEDLQVILPAIKIWCDWMICHSQVWNPPPSCADYRVGPQGDTWTRLALLMNLLEKLEHEQQLQQSMLVSGPMEGYEMVRLPEDGSLSGFTPLMCNVQEPAYTSADGDMEQAQTCYRISRLLFFGTVYLCGCEPPVLKLHKYDDGHSDYISVVRTFSRGSHSSPQDLSSDSDILVESFSEDDGEDDESRTNETRETASDLEKSLDEATTPDDIRNLLHRKEQLERRHRTQEKRRERVQAILQQSIVSVVIEVKPHYLVPDTNCFVDYLAQLQAITKATINAQPIYTLMVPLVVLNELEGLARGGRTPPPASRPTVDPTHVARVADASRCALDFLRSRHPSVRYVTTRGTTMPTSNFTLEEDISDLDVGPRNDDRILTTALSLCRTSNRDRHEEGEPRRLYREVVLLTDDRNLRVKALARDVPVRELPDFIRWASLQG